MAPKLPLSSTTAIGFESRFAGSIETEEGKHRSSMDMIERAKLWPSKQRTSLRWNRQFVSVAVVAAVAVVVASESLLWASTRAELAYH